MIGSSVGNIAYPELHVDGPKLLRFPDGHHPADQILRGKIGRPAL